MPVIISMLRGVNLGPHHRLKMDALRHVYRSLGLEDPQTYLQSGDVIFRTEERNLKQLAGRIEEAIEASFSFRPAVLLRKQSELADVVAANPFAKRRDIDPAKLLVVFLSSAPDRDSRDQVTSVQTPSEELYFGNRELYIYFANGLARPKLPWTTVERLLKVPGTGRNWNTVTNMLALAERLERA